jgi:Ca-activated chloride channel family protein
MKRRAKTHLSLSGKAKRRFRPQAYSLQYVEDRNRRFNAERRVLNTSYRRMRSVQAGSDAFAAGVSWIFRAGPKTLLLVLAATFVAGCSADWWATPDQQGQRLLDRGEFAGAAERFHDPMRRGVAFYRAGRFKEAAGAFGRVPTAEGAFNRGNALVMAGNYTEAMNSYDRALELRPDWPAAQQNREIARLRLERLHPDVDPSSGTGGEMKADDIVFDDKAKSSPGAEEVEVGAGGGMTDEELRAVWLRSVQTRPSEFLRAKFAYQLSRRTDR